MGHEWAALGYHSGRVGCRVGVGSTDTCRWSHAVGGGGSPPLYRRWRRWTCSACPRPSTNGAREQSAQLPSRRRHHAESSGTEKPQRLIRLRRFEVLLELTRGCAQVQLGPYERPDQ